MKIKIMRKPSRPGDNGRDSFIKKVETMDEALAWISSQRGEFFGPEHYFVMQEPNPQPKTQRLYPELHIDCDKITP